MNILFSHSPWGPKRMSTRPKLKRLRSQARPQAATILEPVRIRGRMSSYDARLCLPGPVIAPVTISAVETR
jgi:hypothetical protein